MRIGVDYYPEHWERERWETDIRMMKAANIKVVRLGEFAWSLYEPVEGEYAFAWMDEAMDFLAANGISVVLCTPSATPPKWMVDQYPEILQDDIHGHPKVFGTRKHYLLQQRPVPRKVPYPEHADRQTLCRPPRAGSLAGG